MTRSEGDWTSGSLGPGYAGAKSEFQASCGGHDVMFRIRVTCRIGLVFIAPLLLGACAHSSPLTIRTAADPNACPAGALPELPATFRIDPSAQEQVVVIGRDGRRYLVWWAPGFVAGDAADPAIRDPNGTVVARDGELLEGPRLHGYTVCGTSDAIYILRV